MLENVLPADEFRVLLRRRQKAMDNKTVAEAKVDAAMADGWSVERKRRGRVRLSRPKPYDVLLEDRVWSLLYQMGFTHISGTGGARLYPDPKRNPETWNQIDTVALDSEVALV